VKLKVKILIRTREGKQQEINLEGVIHNPEINVTHVIWSLERAINDHTDLRVHTDLEE
jgi:hypothetical protein